jgi:hypothetical protein
MSERVQSLRSIGSAVLLLTLLRVRLRLYRRNVVNSTSRRA